MRNWLRRKLLKLVITIIMNCFPEGVKKIYASDLSTEVIAYQWTWHADCLEEGKK